MEGFQKCMVFKKKTHEVEGVSTANLPPPHPPLRETPDSI